jgi:hypothetical protein
MSRQVLSTDLALDAGNDPGINKNLDEWGAVLLRLTDRFLV